MEQTSIIGISFEISKRGLDYLQHFKTMQHPSKDVPQKDFSFFISRLIIFTGETPVWSLTLRVAVERAPPAGR